VSRGVAAAEPRTLAPPERRVAPVLANEALGAYRLLRAHDADGPPDPRPGQFYMLAAAERWGGGPGERPYLPRAFSYARSRPAERGVVLEFLLEAIGPGTERLDADPRALVYACGPPPMLEAVRALCLERAAPAQLALESGMACGFGACFGCVVPTREGYLRLCVDGPVLDAELLETALFPGAGH
jgi:NAD(P)H-flavin reductase